MQAEVDRARYRSFLHGGALWMILGKGNGDFSDNPGDSAWSFRSHVLLDTDFGSSDVDFVTLREDAHDSQHTGTEGRCDEIGV